jgi:hypothetical protein
MTSTGIRADAARPTAAPATTQPALRLAYRLTALVIPLAVIAAAAGLLVPNLYQDPEGLIPVLRGQDLLTLLAMPATLLALQAARRGSSRGIVLLFGLLGYVLYTYTGAAFNYHWNALLYLYMALFSLSAAAVASLAVGLNATRVKGTFGTGTPILPVTAFLWVSAVFLALPEVAQTIPFFTEGKLPTLLVRAGTTSSFVFTLDIAVITPLMVLAAWWLPRGAPWGFVLAGVMLVKSATMGLALLSMTLFDVLNGGALEVFMTVIYAAITAGGLGLGSWFLGKARD